MFEPEKYNDIREVTDKDLEGIKKLGDDEYLLKVYEYTTIAAFGERKPVGFMTKLTKSGEIPASFESWQPYTRTPLKMYIITEKYRRGWTFTGLRHGTSTAWVVLEHPYGFTIEINESAFAEIVNSITMVNGMMITPCYFEAKLKNAKLLVKKDNGQDFFYSLIHAISDDTDLLNKLKDIVEEERPDKVYNILTS